MEEIIGKIIDNNFQILEVLGKGGMGVVYKAKDITLDRDVALKMMDSALARDEDFLKRFKSEAKALARLQNVNIVSVFALRETEIGFCLVMEFVEGNTLADQIRDGAMSVEKALPIFKQMLIALDHAHKIGVIHRDIKPSNIMLTKDGVVKVTDFGLAKIQQVSSATMTLGTGGTLFYMSPEQIRGLANVDQRGDIYSLGMTLYETLVGRVPFTNTDTDFSIRQAIVEGKITPADKLNPNLPKGIVKVINKSIEKDPAKRYQTAAEMWAELEKVLPGGQGVTQKKGPGRKEIEARTDPSMSTSGSKNRKPLLISVGLAAIIIVVYIVYIMIPRANTPSVSIITNPQGAQVSVNGQTLGASPLKDLHLEAGVMSMRVSAAGYQTLDSSLTISGTGDLTFDLTLKPLPKQLPNQNQSQLANGSVPVMSPTSDAKATLVVQVVPTGSVAVDGVVKTSNARLRTSIRVAVGDHQIEFAHPQFGTKKVPLLFKSGESKSLTCYFEGYVSIAVTGQSQWGTIIIDGKKTDEQAPADRLPVSPGRHTVSVTREGFETVGGPQTVTFEPSLTEMGFNLSFMLKMK